MHYKGIELSLTNRKDWVAIIGTRNPTKEEAIVAYSFGYKMAEKGKIVISGLADGIDAAGHRGALDGGGKTIAIVSTSKDESIYPPENQPLAERIIKQGGIMFPFDTKTPRKNPNDKAPSMFVRRLWERDILLAYLNPFIFVVKDSDEPVEGGTRWALNYGRKFGKQLFRVDSKGKIHSDVSFKPAKYNWEMEFKLEDYD